jgi:hypothetical protein
MDSLLYIMWISTVNILARVSGIIHALVPIYIQQDATFFFYLRSYDSCRRHPEPKHHSFLFNHWSASRCLVSMAARTPSIHVFFGRPLCLLTPGIHSIINFGSLSSCILLTWPYMQHYTVYYIWKLLYMFRVVPSSGAQITVFTVVCAVFAVSR